MHHNKNKHFYCSAWLRRESLSERNRVGALYGMVWNGIPIKVESLSFGNLCHLNIDVEISTSL